mgnify:CR=1 FL=1
MKFTNKYNLPEYLYNLLSHEWYGGANAVHDFSVTQMCNPVCMTILQNRHKEDLESDVMDKYFQTIGTGIHHLAEIANKNKKYVSIGIYVNTVNFKIKTVNVQQAFQHGNVQSSKTGKMDRYHDKF